MKRPNLNLSFNAKVGISLGVLIVGVVAVFYHIENQTRAQVISDRITDARKTIGQFKTIRSYYTKNVVKKAKGTGAVAIGIDHKSKKDMIPLPATMIHELSETYSKEKDSLTLNLYSAYPFPNRQARTLDAYQMDSIDFLSKNPKEDFVRVENVAGRPTVRVAIGDHLVAQGCVSCHNSYPNSPKTDWELGDMRGVLQVDIPIDSQLKANSELLLHAKVAIFMVIFFAVGFMVLSVLNLTKSIGKVSSQLRRQAQSLSTKSGTIKTAFTTVLERTSKNSSSLDQISTSLQEYSGIVSENTDSAKRADNLSDQSKSVATASETQVRELTEGISEISESSTKIESIINVIEDIAFQTNLLALNAAVEAARAGEQGKGFAVVAEAVRGLAQKSSDAAKEITVLIQESVNRVEEGSAKANAFEEILKEIVNTTQQVSELNKNVASSSEHQIEGLSAIGNSISEIDQSSKATLESVQNSAASADELQVQAEQLEQAVSELASIVRGKAA